MAFKLAAQMNSVAIIGAGITGLTLAFRLRQRGVPVTVYEASDRVGGVIQSIRRDGYLAEFGPNSILETSPKITSLIGDLGLNGRRLYSDPRAENRYLVRYRRPIVLSASPLKFLATPLFSWRAKLRLLREPFVPPSPPDVEENLADFVVRRLGREFLDYAINPLVSGIYAGDPARLSVKHGFPKLHALEQKYGSLIKGQIFGAKERRQRGEVSKQEAKKISFDDGLQVLPDTLGTQLADAIRFDATVRRIEQTTTGWTLRATIGGQEQQAVHAAVAWTAPAHKLASRRVKLVEVIAHPGKRHQPAHPQPGHIHEEPEVPHVGDQRRIPRRIRRLKLRIQEGEHLHIPAIALGVIGIALRLGNMIRNLLE